MHTCSLATATGITLRVPLLCARIQSKYNPSIRNEGQSHLICSAVRCKTNTFQSISDLGAQISASHLEQNGHTIDEAVVRYHHAKHPGAA